MIGFNHPVLVLIALYLAMPPGFAESPSHAGRGGAKLGTYRFNKELGFSARVPPGWLFTNCVPEPESIKDNFTKIDAFIASGGPRIERSNIPEPLVVWVSKLTPRIGFTREVILPINHFFLKNKFKPKIQKGRSYSSISYGPGLTESNYWVYQIFLLIDGQECVIHVFAGTKERNSQSQKTLKEIADSVKPGPLAS